MYNGVPPPPPPPPPSDEQQNHHYQEFEYEEEDEDEDGERNRNEEPELPPLPEHLMLQQQEFQVQQEEEQEDEFDNEMIDENGEEEGEFFENGEDEDADDEEEEEEDDQESVRGYPEDYDDEEEGEGPGGYEDDDQDEEEEEQDEEPQNAEQNQRARMEDALGYLETVKVTFVDSPEVYTRFLDIMKDFKSQTIDTPGVIHRVSRLFIEYPQLVLGFNSFLPQGYNVRYVEGRIVVLFPDERFHEVDPNAASDADDYYEPSHQQQVIRGFGQELEAFDDDNDDEQESSDDSNAIDEESTEDEDDPNRTHPFIQDPDNEIDQVKLEEQLEDEEDFDDEEEDEEDEDEEEEEEDGDVLTPHELLEKIHQRFEHQPEVPEKICDLLQFLSHEERPRELEEEEESVRRFFSLDEKTRTEYVLTAIAKMLAGEPDILSEFLKYIPDYDLEVTVSGDEAEDADDEEEEDVEEAPEAVSTKIEVNEELMDYQEPEETKVEMIEHDQGPSTSTPIKERKTFETIEEAEIKEDDEMLELDGKIREDGGVVAKEEEEGEETKTPHAQLVEYMDKLDARMVKDLQKRLTKSGSDQLFVLIQMFLDERLGKADFLQGLKDVIGWRNKNIIRRFYKMFNKSDDYSDEDSTYEDENCEPPELKRQKLQVRNGKTVLQTPEHFINPQEFTLTTMGVSYRHILRDAEKCTGRDRLCKEVLNDIWTSYPSWSSEDNGNVSSKKSPYEEFLYRTEDERFELDIVLDVNKYAIEAMTDVKQKMDAMSEFERHWFKLDDSLGARSEALMTRAIRKIYGEASARVIQGLKETPTLSVPKVLTRLLEKEKEWRESQISMNKMWREQLEKQMARSLDHQTSNIRQADAKLVKAKNMIHQIESFFDKRQGKQPDNDFGPHISFTYPSKRSIIYDVNHLVIHFLKRAMGLTKEEKRKMKIILRKILPEWFCCPTEDMSDDEDGANLELERKKSKTEGEADDELEVINGTRVNLLNHYLDFDEDEMIPLIEKPTDIFMRNQSNACYRMVYGDNNLFLFTRLHQTICDRVSKVYAAYVEMCDDYYKHERAKHSWEKSFDRHPNSRHNLAFEKNWGNLAPAMHRLRNTKECPLTFYSLFLEDVRKYLDGEIDAAAFDEKARRMFPTEACLFFSIDKLLTSLIKHLLALANNEDDCSGMKMYMRYRFRIPPTVFKTSCTIARAEKEYTQMAEKRLHMRNCFKLEFVNTPNPTVSIVLVDTEESEVGSYRGDDEEGLPSSNESEKNEDVSVPPASKRRRLDLVNGRKESEEVRNDDQLPDQDLETLTVKMADTSVSRRKQLQGITNFSKLPNMLRRAIIVNRPTNRLRLFRYSNFRDIPNVPASVHRGGWYTKRISETIVADRLRRMTEIRFKRAWFIRRHEHQPCALFGDSSIITSHSNPIFPFLTFRRYETLIEDEKRQSPPSQNPIEEEKNSEYFDPTAVDDPIMIPNQDPTLPVSGQGEVEIPISDDQQPSTSDQ